MQNTGQPPSRQIPATITCPSCRTVLRVSDPSAISGPCPACGNHIEIIPVLIRPRHLAEDKAVILPRNQPEYEEAPGAAEPRGPSIVQRFLNTLGLGYDFLNTKNGQAVGGFVIGMMIILCVFLFFKWDRKHNRFTPDPQPPAAGLAPAAPTAAPVKGETDPATPQDSGLAGMKRPVAPLR